MTFLLANSHLYVKRRTNVVFTNHRPFADEDTMLSVAQKIRLYRKVKSLAYFTSATLTYTTWYT